MHQACTFQQLPLPSNLSSPVPQFPRLPWAWLSGTVPRILCSPDLHYRDHSLHTLQNAVALLLPPCHCAHTHMPLCTHSHECTLKCMYTQSHKCTRARACTHTTSLSMGTSDRTQKVRLSERWHSRTDDLPPSTPARHRTRARGRSQSLEMSQDQGHSKMPLEVWPKKVQGRNAVLQSC